LLAQSTEDDEEEDDDKHLTLPFPGTLVLNLDPLFTLQYNNTQGNNDDVIHRPAFGWHQELEAEAPIVALEWLSERSLVFLTLTNELTVVDTALMILLERLDFSEVHALFAEFALSRILVATGTATTRVTNQ
jgi:hypothetical protein